MTLPPQANTQGRIPLILNPGLTFGTGSHATTRLCLTALEEAVHGGETVLDLGCGSGILSIAALRLGAEHAFACDIDEKCVEVAYENAALNGIDRSRYTVRWGDVLSDQQLKAEIGGGYDMVVANIVADVIIGLSGRYFLRRCTSCWRGSFLIKENTTSGPGSCSVRSSLASCSWCRQPCWTMPAPNILRRALPLPF